jgi:hypothetical protein
MATKITTGLIDSGAITSALITDGSITATDLHTTLDLTGKTVTVATATAGDNDTSVASTAFVATAIANLADSAPETLNTLNELAAALGDDANFSTTVTNSIATKLPLSGGAMTGALTSNSLIKTTGNITTASAQPTLFLDRGNGSYTWGIYNGGGTDFPLSSFNIANNTGTAVITALDNGNVGIGTDNPNGKLHVSGGRAGVISTTSSWGQFRVGNTVDGEVGIAYVTGATESDFLGDGDPTCAYKVIMGINTYGAGNRNFGIGNDTILNYHTIWTEAGHQEPRVDNTYDLGSASKGFRNLYATTVTTAGDVNVGGNIIGDDDTSYMRMNAGPSGGGAIYLNGSTRTNYENHIQYMADVHNFGDVDGSPINTLQVVSDSELVTINGNLNVTKPIQTTTDTGTRMYTGLATGSHYGEVGYLILDTNIPGHASSGNANMFSISIEGFVYSQTDGGIIDLNIGCYAGESNYYNPSYSGSNIPDAWVNNMFVSTNSSGKVALIFGTTGAAQNIEIACTKFIQGFINVNTDYANGWDFKVQTGLTGYSQLTVVRPKFTKKPSFSAASSGFSVVANWQVISDSMSQTHDGPDDNYNPSTGRFTPQFPGWYQFNFGGWATYSSSTGQERYAIAFAKNGSTTYLSGGNYSAADSPLGGAGQRIYLNGSTDYVELYAFSSVATQWGGPSHWVWWDGYWTGS